MAGDALLAFAFSHLGEHPHPRTQQTLQIMREGWLQLCAGQVRDEEHEGNCETNLDQAIAVQAAKSAEGMRALCCLLALMTDASTRSGRGRRPVGMAPGMAGQYHNDLSDCGRRIRWPGPATETSAAARSPPPSLRAWSRAIPTACA